MPHDARTLIDESPSGVQIAPTRGAKLAQLALGGAAARVAVVTGEHQPRRRLRVDGAALVLVEAGLVEVADPRIGVAQRDVRLPAQADVEAEVRPHAPVVLHVDADVVVVVVVVDRVALQEPAAHRADHEVGHRQPGALAVEGELAVGRPVVEGLDLGVDPVHAGRDLVVAAHQVEVVDQLEADRVEVAGVGGAGADREAVAGDADAHVALERAGDVAAQLGGGEIARQRPVVQRAVEGDVQRVDQRAGRQPLVAGDHRVGDVLSGRCGSGSARSGRRRSPGSRSARTGSGQTACAAG